MQEFLIQYAENRHIAVSKDWKGNIYLTKGKVENGGFYPCLTAHMDTVHSEQEAYVASNTAIPLITSERQDGKHKVYADGNMGLGGDDKAGIVIALSAMEHLEACKAVFFVEEEIGRKGSYNTDLKWFGDVGYVIGFDSPGFNQASWSCNGVKLFDKEFYETELEPFHKEFGLTSYVAHPYTDVLMLRINTSLACMNWGAGYYNLHTPSEYVVPEEMDKTVAMALAFIQGLGHKECVIPYAPRHKAKDDKDYDYFDEMFRNIEKAKEMELECNAFIETEFSRVEDLKERYPQLKKQGYRLLARVVELFYDEDWNELESYMDIILDIVNSDEYPELNDIPQGFVWEIIDHFNDAIHHYVERRKEELSKIEYAPSDYTIEAVPNFNEMKKFAPFTSWCVCHNVDDYDHYTDGGELFYVCKKSGFENVSKKVTEGAPWDNYGKSLIAVAVNRHGIISEIYSRWDIDDIIEGMPCDEWISRLIGQNFYEVFLPRELW